MVMAILLVAQQVIMIMHSPAQVIIALVVQAQVKVVAHRVVAHR